MSRIFFFLAIGWYAGWLVADYEAAGTSAVTWRYPLAFVGAMLLMTAAVYWSERNGPR